MGLRSLTLIYISERMKRLVLPFLLIGLSNIALNASQQEVIEGNTYTIDTIGHCKVGPGTTHTRLLFKSEKKFFRAEVLTMEMKGHENVEYRMEIGQDSTLSTERISSIAQRKSNSEQQYFAGVNADFFITTSYVAQYAGEPHMDCIMNGEIASTGYLNASDYGHFFMDREKNMWCDNPTQTFSISYPDGSTTTLARINEDIHDGETVLFNSKYGKQTRVSGCTEVSLALAEGEAWSVNKPVKLIVTGAPTSAGVTKITQGGAVLSAKGSSDVEKISALKVGDELTATFNISLQDYGTSPDIKECSGGDVVVLKRGEIIYEAIRFINSRDGDNPRTMLGYNEDRSKMMWCVIDGRQGNYSQGCTYPEGAAVMRIIGCYDALNVDGGGSTGMYIAPMGIVNSPSDGSERAVANGIFAVLKAPVDNEIAEIRFKDWKMVFPKYGIYRPVIYGYNKYGLLIDTDVEGFTLSCPEELGEITDEGSTFFGNGSGSHALTASYNGLSASISVTVDAGNQPEFTHKEILIDNYRQWTIGVQSLVNEEYMTIAPQALSWASSSEDIATVSSEGVLSGIKDGESTITGTVGDFTGEIKVTVECPTDRVMAIDDDFDASSWTFAKGGVKNATLSNSDNGVAFDFTVSSTRSAYVKMSKDSMRIWSLPDAIRLRVIQSDSIISKITIGSQPNNDRSLNRYLTPELKVGVENVVDLPVSDIADINDIGIYPITLSSIRFDLGPTMVSTGKPYKIEVTGIEAVYNNSPVGVEEISSDRIAQRPKLGSNVVEQGNAVMIETDDVASNWAVYSISGLLMAHGSGNTISTESLPHGLYIVTVNNHTGLKLIVK